ncbi:MAG: SDR family oxidoreductase [Candidatus Aminicenantaceae bacterium]
MTVNYLVTGGAGFIGSNIVRQLLKINSNVKIIDNLSTGNINNIKDIFSDLDFIKGDIRDIHIVNKAMKGIDYVLHQAALPSVPRSIKNPVESNENNITGTLNVLLSARDNGIKRVVYASSSSVYGDTPTLPKKEDMTPSPLSPYALTKLTGEHYCKIFSSVYGLQTISLRYFNIFGPGQNPESQYAAVIPKFIESLLRGKPPVVYGNGNQTRDFTFVDNAVSANILACQTEKTSGETVNIATGVQTSLNQLIQILKEITNLNIPAQYDSPREGDILHSLADLSLANKLLGYKPVIHLKEGLQKSVKWMKTYYQ